ncbi:heterokaryon incompatibility protein-domain-containing protein [Paraphoma chrysanthemicola]|uniref:Heterokaryon incompatibility protein-domain-containing protein n=1 Tax=Paraphoma chrysanthemicola TaxID=798071 RepID=A0A8K0VWP8_9PLEO|nr:heterokaryon incompatibility protein-domain-containing protein [Paraphoma chrysanthemicola]
MASRCPLCNDFEPGHGEAIPFRAWIEFILGSKCQHCRTLAAAINTLHARLLSVSELEGEPEQRDDVRFQADVADEGRIYIRSLWDDWGRAELQLQFFRLSLPHVPNYVIGGLEVPVLGEIAPEPGDPAMWDFLRASLQTCLNKHTDCANEQDTSWFPERLLFVQHTTGGRRVVKLIQTASHPPQSAYIALSHCWGSEKISCTTTQNIHAHEIGIDVSSLPRTFQDAFTVAEELGISYVWIDSLCIIQDQQANWAIHAGVMDKIYENAQVVVAAVSSSSGQVPFLGPEAPTDRHSYRAISLDSIRPNDSGIDAATVNAKVRCTFPLLDPDFITGPLEKRAWAWQERYCAVRVISFTDIEAKWSCKSATGCECVGTLRARGLRKWRSTKDKPADDEANVIFEEWRELVNEYAKRNLTYATDRLPAIAGIASRFHSLTKSNYVAGLWEDELPFNLGWYRRDLTDTPSATPLIPPSLDNGVPTWSWASMFWTCYWQWEYYFGTPLPTTSKPTLQRKNQAEVLRVDCAPSTSNTFGAVQTGSFIELRGRVIPGILECDEFGSAGVSIEGFKQQLVVLDCKVTQVTTVGNSEHLTSVQRASSHQVEGSRSENEQGDATHTVQRPTTRIKGPVSCLLLYSANWNNQPSACVLILAQVPGVDPTCYQRLGLGCGHLTDWSGSYYRHRKDWAVWQGWDDLEEWKEWERLFADAEVADVKLV